MCLLHHALGDGESPNLMTISLLIPTFACRAGIHIPPTLVGRSYLYNRHWSSLSEDLRPPNLRRMLLILVSKVAIFSVCSPDGSAAIHESMFGNTEQIANAVAAGLGESVDVQVTEVADAPTDPGPDVALIVAGGPTHAFSMSRENTRADAISKGAPEGEREFGLREPRRHRMK